jgi:hypothetical protein
MIAIAALHVVVITFVAWTTLWIPAIAIAAIDSADLIAIVAVVDVVARTFERSKGLGHRIS